MYNTSTQYACIYYNEWNTDFPCRHCEWPRLPIERQRNTAEFNWNIFLVVGKIYHNTSTGSNWQINLKLIRTKQTKSMHVSLFVCLCVCVYVCVQTFRHRRWMNARTSQTSLTSFQLKYLIQSNRCDIPCSDTVLLCSVGTFFVKCVGKTRCWLYNIACHTVDSWNHAIVASQYPLLLALALSHSLTLNRAEWHWKIGFRSETPRNNWKHEFVTFQIIGSIHNNWAW